MNCLSLFRILIAMCILHVCKNTKKKSKPRAQLSQIRIATEILQRTKSQF